VADGRKKVGEVDRVVCRALQGQEELSQPML